ncbi:glycosyltransferase family 2 protein [Myceligenerans indicum]|uniref:Glycosyltransferase n=1 Tax=Myceligenerans indicum TaxID=2593663 RepID=A0ABS1LMP7_9MICO|nr:glycosyltransferase [Myceligenerans indicum]MBL0887531.1 glycosyltransferase [Myceligenerans indicum]
MGTDGDVALITVTYNSARALTEFWRNRPFGRYPWTVVDNASSDGSARVAEDLGAQVLALPSNVGFSAANNLGAASVDAEVLIFCNPDVTVTADGIAALAGDARRYGGIIAPQLVNVDGTPQENGRGTPFLSRKAKHLFRLPDERYQRFARPGELADVVWVMGAALAVTRRAFDALAGWDDGFFVYYEDADLGVRAWQQGLSVRVDGDVRWQHGWGRETGRGFSPHAWKHELASAWRFYRKHPYCLLPMGRRAHQLHRIDSAGAMIGVRA